MSASKAQLGLGHSYSRCKVKFNVNRTDNMIIQSINLLDQLDKDINTFSMRCRLVYIYVYGMHCVTADQWNGSSRWSAIRVQVQVRGGSFKSTFMLIVIVMEVC